MKRQRKNRRGQRHATRKKAKEPKACESNTYQDPVYGAIPIVIKSIILPSGETHEVHVVDPNFRMKIPRGAVRADIRKQSYRFSGPHFYYLDEEKRCQRCKQDFVFSGEEKKFWYETMGFCFDSRAIHCASCRRIRRRIKALHCELGRVRAALRKDSNDVPELLALTKTTVMLWELARCGDLDGAVGAARKAGRLRSKEHKTSAEFWEKRAVAARGQA